MAKIDDKDKDIFEAKEAFWTSTLGIRQAFYEFSFTTEALYMSYTDKLWDDYWNDFRYLVRPVLAF